MTIRRLGYAVGGALLVFGVGFLLAGLVREHQDVQGLWLLALGYAGIGSGVLGVLAAAAGPRGRRVLAGLVVAGAIAALAGIAALIVHAVTSPEPVRLDSLEDAPPGVPVPERAPQAPTRDATTPGEPPPSEE